MTMKKIDDILNLIRDKNCEKRIKGILLASNVKCLIAFIQPVFMLKDYMVWQEQAVVVAKRTDSELFPYLDLLVSWSLEAEFDSPDGSFIASRLWRMERTDEFNSLLKGLRKEYAAKGFAEYVCAVDCILKGEKPMYLGPVDEPFENRPEFSQFIEGKNDPCDIDVAVEMMKSTNPEEIQEQGRAIARSIESIYCFSDVLVHPEQEASRLNLAKILCEHPDKDLQHGELLFPWLEDMEKPYAKLCFERLVQMEPDDTLDRCILNILEQFRYGDPKTPTLQKLKKVRKEKYYTR